jgi:CheY-like chemotaxis protein
MPQNPTRRPPWVLVVDKDAGTREMLRECLRSSGVDATEVVTATDALKKVSDTPPNAVLLDMAHPDLDGYDLCRLLRDRPDTHRTPIIALTSAHPADVQRALDAGCNVVLVKPCSTKYVLLELRRVLPPQSRATA